MRAPLVKPALLHCTVTSATITGRGNAKRVRAANFEFLVRLFLITLGKPSGYKGVYRTERGSAGCHRLLQAGTECRPLDCPVDSRIRRYRARFCNGYKPRLAFSTDCISTSGTLQTCSQNLPLAPLGISSTGSRITSTPFIRAFTAFTIARADSEVNPGAGT